MVNLNGGVKGWIGRPLIDDWRKWNIRRKKVKRIITDGHFSILWLLSKKTWTFTYLLWASKRAFAMGTLINE
jgi:hypothetical protein